MQAISSSSVDTSWDLVRYQLPHAHWIDASYRIQKDIEESLGFAPMVVYRNGWLLFKQNDLLQIKLETLEWHTSTEREWLFGGPYDVEEIVRCLKKVFDIDANG